jgi:4-hydroxy-3-polyprenylbenzoate decarboxylase
MTRRRIVLAVTGASGMPYAVTLARVLAATPDMELHLILSDAAKQVLELESDVTAAELSALAHRTYAPSELDAGPASGSWRHDGMAVCPCSMASLAAIAHGLGSNLVHRAADTTLKEGRRLVLVPRETPLSTIHLQNMLAARQAGAVILPPCPGFYHRPASLDDLVDFVAARVLSALGIEHRLLAGWREQEVS